MTVPLQRTNHYLLFIILSIVILYFGRPLLVPVVFGALFAMLMAPISRYLDKILLRSLSSLIATLIVATCMFLILWVAVWQFSAFLEDVPAIRERAENLVSAVELFIEDTFAISISNQRTFAKKLAISAGESVGVYAGQVVASLSSAGGWLVLSLIFTFLFLYQRERYETFFIRIFKNQEPERVRAIVHKISHVSEQYLLGRTYSILLLFFCYSVGLLLIGIKNAIVLAAVASLLTFVPYVGTIIGSFFPVIMAILTEDTYEPALWTAAVMIAMQAFDNYFVEPYVIGKEVNLSAMAVIFIIVAGGLIWGVAGAILFIPLLGIIKIICDHVESLQPYGYLIGDPDAMKPSRMRLWLHHFFRKRRT